LLLSTVSLRLQQSLKGKPLSSEPPLAQKRNKKQEKLSNKVNNRFRLMLAFLEVDHQKLMFL
jgi:hypothetical protein